MLLLLLVLASPPPEATVEALLAAHLGAHPRVVAAEARARAAGAAVGAEGWWPQPQLAVSVSPLPIETRNGPAWATVKVGQALPWGGALDAQVDGAQARAAAARAAVAEARIGVALAARRAAASLRQIEAEQEINAHTITLVRRLVAQVQARLSVDAAAQTDVLQAQVTLAQLENTSLDLVQRRAIARVALNTALGREPGAPLPVLSPGPPVPTALDALLARLADHPKLAALAAQVDRARATRRGASYGRLPRFKVGVGYTLITAPEVPAGADPGRDALHVEAGLTLPLWSGTDAAEAAAEAATEAARAAKDDAAQALTLAVMRHHTRLETALRAVALHETTVLPLARQRMEVLEAAYAADRARFLDVIDAQHALERYETDFVRARAEAERALADLRAAVGEEIR